MSIKSEKPCIVKNLEEIQILPHQIQKIAEREGFISCHVSTRDLNTGGGNFLGELYEIEVKGESVTGEKNVNLFVKLKINLEKAVLISTTDAFRNEEFFYKELSMIFTILQDEAQVPPDDRFKFAKAYSETSTDAIILENLSIKDFKTYDRMDTLPLKCVELTLEQMAKFHGLSFVIEHKMPEYHDNKIKVLEHPLCYDEDWSRLMQKSCMYVANLFEGITKTKVEKYIPIFIDKYAEYNRDKISTKCTLTHGDYRSTNILIREEEGEPVETIIVDYQFMDYGCPMKDLVFAILANTDQGFRKDHMNDLKNLYFDTLSRFLKYFELDVELVYPRKVFEEAFSHWMDYGLMRMFFCLPFMFAPETGVDLKTMTLAELPFSLDDNLKERVRGLILDFVDWGYL